MPNGGQAMSGGHESTNLGDILERVLDRGLVIAGDIKVSLLDIELLTLKLRLVVASVDTARQMGIDWWEHDPWLTSRGRRNGEWVEGQEAPSGQLERGTSAALDSAGEMPDRPTRRKSVATDGPEARNGDDD